MPKLTTDKIYSQFGSEYTIEPNIVKEGVHTIEYDVISEDDSEKLHIRKLKSLCYKEQFINNVKMIMSSFDRKENPIHSGIIECMKLSYTPEGEPFIVSKRRKKKDNFNPSKIVLSLSNIINNKQLSYLLTADVGCRLISILDSLHTAGLYHTDLTPRCIYLRTDNTVEDIQRDRNFDLVIDIFTDHSFMEINDDREYFSSAAQQYSSLKFLNGDYGSKLKIEAGKRNNYFTVGVIMYEMLTGKNPFIDTRQEDFNENSVEANVKTLIGLLPENLRRKAYIVYLAKCIVRMITLDYDLGSLEICKYDLSYIVFCPSEDEHGVFPSNLEYDRMLELYVPGEKWKSGGLGDNCTVYCRKKLLGGYYAKKVYKLDNVELERKINFLESAKKEINSYQMIELYEKKNNIRIAPKMYYINTINNDTQEAKKAASAQIDKSIEDSNMGLNASVTEVSLRLEVGISLYQYIQWFSMMERNDRRTVKFVQAMLNSLYHLHKCGIYHKDIKPGNILLLKRKDDDELTCDVVFMDFNISHNSIIFDPDNSEKIIEVNKELTTALGTENYIAPELMEVRRNKKTLSELNEKYSDLGIKCDVYSISVVIYLVLICQIDQILRCRFKNRRLFPSSPDDALKLISDSDSKSIKALKELVARGISYDPSKRPSSEEMKKEIDRIACMVDNEELSAKTEPKKNMSDNKEVAENTNKADIKTDSDKAEANNEGNEASSNLTINYKIFAVPIIVKFIFLLLNIFFMPDSFAGKMLVLVEEAVAAIAVYFLLMKNVFKVSSGTQKISYISGIIAGAAVAVIMNIIISSVSLSYSLATSLITFVIFIFISIYTSGSSGKK